MSRHLPVPHFQWEKAPGSRTEWLEYSRTADAVILGSNANSDGASLKLATQVGNMPMTTLKGREAYLFKNNVKCMIMKNTKRNGKKNKSTPVNTEQIKVFQGLWTLGVYCSCW